MSDNYEIWTTDEVMDYLLIGRNTLYNLLRNGKIKGFKIGSCWKNDDNSKYRDWVIAAAEKSSGDRYRSWTSQSGCGYGPGKPDRI